MDRAKARESTEIDAEVAERERRLEALKELARNPETGEVDMELIIQQSKAMGGDAKSTHLVKGLDFALLERVKRGEDVLGIGSGSKGSKGSKSKEQGEDEERLEGELDKALGKTIVPVEKEKVKKPRNKVTREEMLAGLKRQKAAVVTSKAAAAPPVPVLGSRFKRIGQPKPKKKESKDGKSQKKKAKGHADGGNKSNTPLGMLPPPLPATRAVPGGKDEGDDIDIFDDAGRDYDPLAGLGGDDSDSDSSADEKKTLELKGKQTDCQEKAAAAGDTAILSSMPPPPRPKPNYFLESEDDQEERYEPPTPTSALLAHNPDLAAALSKAANLAQRGGPSSASAEELEKEKRRKAMLENFDRDAMDMDMGFGGSRDWGDDEEEFVEGSKGGKKRKRGPKGPKKGDKNNAELVSKIATEKYGKG